MQEDYVVGYALDYNPVLGQTYVIIAVRGITDFAMLGESVIANLKDGKAVVSYKPLRVGIDERMAKKAVSLLTKEVVAGEMLEMATGKLYQDLYRIDPNYTNGLNFGSEVEDVSGLLIRLRLNGLDNKSVHFLLGKLRNETLADKLNTVADLFIPVNSAVWESPDG